MGEIRHSNPQKRWSKIGIAVFLITIIFTIKDVYGASLYYWVGSIDATSSFINQIKYPLLFTIATVSLANVRKKGEKGIYLLVASILISFYMTIVASSITRLLP